MSWQTIQIEVKGLTPLLLHNGQTTDTLNPYSKRLKEVTGLRKKTDADQMEIARIEWEASLYTDEKEQVVVPGVNIESMIISAAKKIKQGVTAKASILSDGMWPLLIGGKAVKVSKILNDPAYIDKRRVVISRAAVMRTRPIFRDWDLTFSLSYDPDSVNEKDVIKMVDIAGSQIGLGDFRPKFGRFAVTKVS